MLAKRIIPCLDVKAGRVVKGTQFLNLKDAGDPVEVAMEYDRQGADELCFLDIGASLIAFVFSLVDQACLDLVPKFPAGMAHLQPCAHRRPMELCRLHIWFLQCA